MKWLSPLILLLVLSCRFVSEAAAPRYFTVLKSFGLSEQSVAAPSGELCLGSDGRFYGLGEGGMDQTIVHPVIFSVAQDGSDLKILYRGDFGDPGGGLIEATDGRLYGYGLSGLYSLRKDGSDFRLWPTPGRWDTSKLLEGSDGFLYATSEGDVFRVRKDGEGFEVLREFSGGLNPARRTGNSLLEFPAGVLIGTYGKGYNGGGIYRMNLDGSDYRLIQEFFVSTNGSTKLHSPSTGLKLADGKLFGAAINMTNGRPTMFSMRMDGSELTLLHTLSQDPASELVVGLGQKIRGTSGGAMFEMDYDGSNYKETAIRRDDSDAPIRPTGTPVIVGDRLYGLARILDSGWADGFVYEFRPELEPATRILSRLSYSGGEGWSPNALLYSRDGNLYGATMRGGEFDKGTVWRIGENGQDSRTLRSFESVRDGGSPVALIEGADSWLYGIIQGTPYNIDSRYHVEYTPWNGDVFRLSKTGETFDILRSHRFEWASGVTAGKDGRIYVTVSKRPEATNETAYIYSMKVDGSDYTEVARFEPADTVRLGKLLEATDGNFYVTGGAKIFRVSRNGEIHTIHEEALYWAPYALMEGSDGGLYGNNTREGFFRMNKDGSGYSFQRLSGPLSTVGKQMVEDNAGEFLVVDELHLYRVNQGKEYPEITRSFTPWQNQWEGEPVHGLVKGGNGVVYGLMQSGGAMGIGAIFRLGNWTEAPQLELRRTNLANLGNLMIRARISMGTAFRVESAPSAEGPWSDTLAGGISLQPDGAQLWYTAATNQFFRARLVEY
jgi:uncharacterized repeat protein (TIGR03803 family)